MDLISVLDALDSIDESGGEAAAAAEQRQPATGSLATNVAKVGDEEGADSELFQAAFGVVEPVAEIDGGDDDNAGEEDGEENSDNDHEHEQAVAGGSEHPSARGPLKLEHRPRPRPLET